MSTCDLCHDEASSLMWRLQRLRVCPDCAGGIDYEAAMTPQELRADHAAAAAYVDNRRDVC